MFLLRLLVTVLLTSAYSAAPTDTDIYGKWTLTHSESHLKYDSIYTSTLNLLENGQFTLNGELSVINPGGEKALFSLAIKGGGSYIRRDGKIILNYAPEKMVLKPDFTDTPGAAKGIVNRMVIPGFEKALSGEHISTIKSLSDKEMSVLTEGNRLCVYKRP